METGSITTVKELEPFVQGLYQAIASSQNKIWLDSLVRVCGLELRDLKKPFGEVPRLMKVIRTSLRANNPLMPMQNCPKCGMDLLSHLKVL